MHRPSRQLGLLHKWRVLDLHRVYAAFRPLPRNLICVGSLCACKEFHKQQKGPSQEAGRTCGVDTLLSVCVYIDIFINKRQALVTEMLCFQVGRKVLSHVVPSR